MLYVGISLVLNYWNLHQPRHVTYKVVGIAQKVSLGSHGNLTNGFHLTQFVVDY